MRVHGLMRGVMMSGKFRFQFVVRHSPEVLL